MNWDQIKGKWKQLTGSAPKHWGKLTDDDVQTLTGQKINWSGRFKSDTGS